jgi:hypothetical protein
MLLNLIIFKFVSVFEDINNRLVNILSQKNKKKYQKHSFVMIHHPSGPRNKNLIDVRKNFILSSGTQAGDLYVQRIFFCVTISEYDRIRDTMAT